MKRLSLVAIALILAACAQGPTQPDIQSSLTQTDQPSVMFARNPAVTGQPGVACGIDNPTEPAGFGTGGFANAEDHYAGEGPGSAHADNERAESQYDVACYQLSHK